MKRPHRRPRAVGKLPEHRGADRRRARAWLRRHPSRLRLPVRERRLRPGLHRRRHRLHRPGPRRDPHDGRQGAGPQDRQGGGCAHRTGLARAGQRRRGGHQGGPRGRLSVAGQGGGGRRRARHARDPGRGAAARGAGARVDGGQVGLRRRLRLYRTLYLARAPRRDPGVRRWRGRHPPGRAGMLDPAPPPEAAGGKPVAGAVRRNAAAHGQAACALARAVNIAARARWSSSWTARAANSSSSK